MERKLLIRAYKEGDENKILEFLSINYCALSSQIINDFKVNDSRYISDCLNQLIQKKKINKVLYKGLKFYVIPGNETEIINKVKLVQSYILDITKNYGPIKSKPLVNKIKEQQPENYTLFNKAISSFKPNLIINKVKSSYDTFQIVSRIQDVTKRNVLIDIKYLGHLSFQQEIEDSARDLVPVISKYPNGNLAKEIDYILENLFKVFCILSAADDGSVMHWDGQFWINSQGCLNSLV